MTRRPRNWDTNGEVDALVYDLAYRFEDPLAGVRMHGSLEEIDKSRIPTWINEVKQAEANLHQFRLQLEALAQPDRTCACGTPIAGRSDRRYCSTRCRVREHRKLNLGEL